MYSYSRLAAQMSSSNKRRRAAADGDAGSSSGGCDSAVAAAAAEAAAPSSSSSGTELQVFQWEPLPLDLEDRYQESALFSPAEFRHKRTSTMAVAPAQHVEDDEPLDVRDLLPAASAKEEDTSQLQRPAVVLGPARERSARGAAGHAISRAATEVATDADHPLTCFRPVPSAVAAAPTKRYELVYRNYAPPVAQPPEHAEPEPMADDEVLLRVALYDGKTKRQEWLVYGTQSLLDLRQVLDCVTTDKLNYQGKTMIKQGSHLRLPSDSAMLYVEGTFYVSGPKDLSEQPRRWLATKGIAAEPPRQMEETSFEQLWLRLGKQYLFLHQGSCEHAIVFTQCWMATALDERNRVMYPLLAFQRKGAHKMCGACRRFTAEYECHDDPQADAWPTYLCKGCTNHFYYDRDGNLLQNEQRPAKMWPYIC